MLFYSYLKKGTTLLLVGLASLLVGAFVLATFDKTVVVSEQLMVIPGEVTSDSWTGVEKILSGDLIEDSLYQNFTEGNSAYLDSGSLKLLNEQNEQTVVEESTTGQTQIEPEPDSQNTGGDNESDIYQPEPTDLEEAVEPDVSIDETLETPTGTELPTDVQSDSNGVSEAESEIISSPELEPETEPEPEPEPEPETEPEPEVSTEVSWGVFPLATKKYPFAQEIITTNVTSTEEVAEVVVDEAFEPEIVNDASDTTIETPTESPAETLDGEIISEFEPITTQTNESEIVDENLEAEDEIISSAEATIDSSEISEVMSTSSDYEEITEEEVVEEEEVVPTVEDACAGDLECRMYSTIFSGFSMPEFETGNFLATVALRLSLAAKTKPGTTAYPQRYVVEYTYDSAEAWRTATVIDINDEISNSINGGYFLVSLDKPLQQNLISNLRVRISYQGNINYLDKAYIEGLWLEITSASFYEETDPMYLNGAIDYSRELAQPKFHDLNNPDLDPVMSELPAFTLSYSPQQGFIKRALTSIFSENTYAVDTVRIIDGAGTQINVPIDVVYHENETWTLKFLEQPQKMVPGKYTLELVVNENDTLYTDSFEFYWGVLAVNTTKSMYFANEDVTLNMAALTEDGDTICEANLQLKIIDPDNNIFEVPVEQSGSCGKNNVTDVPDYLAYFKNTNQQGLYTVQLKHLNRQGEMVHSIQDHFEVRDYIPYDIERTAPTRIYPPAPYEVALKIKANRSFVGDIVERVPRGFVISEFGEAEILSMPDYTEIVWRNVVMQEGDKIELSYKFDAPDISPYLYLLGPLSLDGFKELRQWQIASDALTAMASFYGTRTVASANLNGTPSPLQWSTSSVDNFYYTHSTSSNSHEITIRQAGDYFLAVNIPMERTDANVRGTRIGVEVRVNGATLPQSLGRSGYITNNGGSHKESSTNAQFLLNDLSVNDVVTVYAEGLTTINAADIVNVTGRASMLLEYIGTTENVFSATTTRTTNSTNLNQTTEYAFQWIEQRQDSGFTHSDVTNSEQIIIANPGTYLVQANIPITTDTTNTNIQGRVRLDGVLVSGGEFKQGYSQAPGTESDGDSSLHFSGIVVATTTNQVLTLTATREGNTGTVTVSSGFVGSVLVRELPSTELIALRGNAVVGGTNWNPAAAAAIQWSTSIAKDSSIFTHSTTSNSHQITITSGGDYYLSYNDALTGTVARANSRVQVLKNGTAISGAQTKSHYIRNQNGHTDSSGSMVMLLEGLVNTDIITITTVAEAAAGTLDDTTDAVLLLWKKETINYRPDAPIMYNAPFDNIRFASTTPYFDFSATDPDGTANIEYEFSIATSTGFTASTTFNSASDSEFINTASSSDTSPFVEGNKIRLQLTSGDSLTDLTTYYWRVRARDIGGSGEFGDWSVTQSLTVDMSVPAPSWFQSYSGQFEGDTLVGAVSSGGDQVQVDATVSSEVLIAYGEGTVTTPRYRFWDGANWGVEGSAQAVTNTINWVRTAASVSRDEYIMVTLDASNDAYAQIYSASSSSWGNLTLLSPVVTSVAYRGIATAYESLSGDAMAVSCTNGPNPVYRIWNGSSWSATSSITVSSLNNCNFLELAADPDSDEMILVVRDTGTQYEALVWNGTAWAESRVLGSSALVAREGLSVAYESSGDQAIVAVSDNANNNIIYTTWNGVEFSTNATQAIGNDIEFARLTSDPASDEIALCYIDTDNDIGVLRWDGGVWLGSFQEIDTGGNIDTGRPVECAYETLAGRSDYLMAAYSDTTNVRYRAATSTFIVAEATIGTMEDSFWVQTERAGDGTILAVALDDTVDDLNASSWNGTNWAAQETLETSPSSVLAAPYEMYDLSAKRFQFSEGQVTTPPIDFTAVPNQPTWGDVSFSTVEPLGTDVTVRLKYSSTTVCDQYIPNGALSGNDAGFDVADSPIDLTSLSTSTYDQICLEATITTLGSASALLDDWTLAWVRQPKLVQNNYRWFVNGSLLTPTDVWPAGATDVAENTALTSATAVNINESIRLRMSLQGSNVELPAFAEAFKLQYAEGFTCNNSLTWRDVGGPASTTALWRGYNNSIVGDDWYSGSWSRRIKLTVDNALVPNSLTSFPVYVNLDDLPDSFFSGVQSDGDDIRITQSDGVTELPFELVSINTSSKIGELHFKADLSSTTDSEFYIYYSNPSASGYSASATYGSRNVWTNGYSLRYALDDSPAAASPQFRDSTSNSNNAVAYAGMTAGDVVAGKIGEAIALDGNDGATFQSALAYAGTFTASMWWQSQVITDGDGFAIAGPAGANEKVGPWNTPSAGRMFVRAVTNSDSNVNSPNDGTWAYVAITRDSSNKIDLHINGTTTRLFADVAEAGTSDWINFGGETTQGFEGLLDELRFSNVRRSNDWIATEYNNQSNSTGFYAVSAEELINDGRQLPSTLLTGSDFAETYEEENPTGDNKNALAVGSDAEWDFVLQNNNAVANTNYCFRLVYEDGSLFNAYTNYPRLITNAPPLAPELYSPFDNERLASTTPWFEFAATDEIFDDVAYQIQVDTDVNFGSPDIDSNSISNFALFTNLLQPSQKSEFTSGQRIRFESPTTLTNGNTYWWRVRAEDLSGSGEYGDWSTPYSVTINTSNVITTWFQTTGSQFSTNNLLDTIASTGTNDIGLDSGFTAGTTTSDTIDYDDRTTGNAWGDFSFTHNVTSGTIRYYFEYLVSGTTYAVIPDTALPGNSSGFTTSPVVLTDLNTSTYNEIRIVAVFSGNSTLPRLQDWTVTWAETIEVPSLVQPFDNAKVATTTPLFTFYSTDPESDAIQYEIQLSSDSDFLASSTFTSGVSAGFSNTASTTNSSPYISGDLISYRAQTALTNGNTYWWRARAKDPGGADNWSEYSSAQSITIDTAITISAWHQTTGDQFDTDTLDSIETTAGGAQITSTVNEVLMAYGEGTGQAPRYRIWNGNSWSAADTAASVGAQIRWTELDASPTRPEYALGTVGTDNDMNVQIYDADADSWGNVEELTNSIPDTLQRGFDITYETTSGDLLAVSCSGNDAVYSIWNGTSWTATSSLTLANTNNCLYIELASDPTSDEVVAVFKHTNTSTTDYEIKVWDGSAWGNSLALADMNENANAGAAVVYEESGNQAIVALTNNLATTLLYALWNGSAWATSTHALGDHIEWATLRRDDGSDDVSLCYVDNDTNAGVLFWDGSAWVTPFIEIEQTARTKAGHPIDCAYETLGTRDGYLMAPYSDGTNGRYQFYATSSFNGELSISTITDSWRVIAVRGGDGIIHSVFFDDTNDRYDTSRWDGVTWTTREPISTTPSITGTPFDGSLAIAARTYPNFISGSIRSTPIDFNDGAGPRWEEINFNETTPGSSYIEYRLYYLASTSNYVLVPDTALPGNSTGFTSSPIDISALDRTIYETLALDAQLICVSGNCPVLNDWTIEWSEGITVSGTAYEYNASTTLTSGTVAVAVNGVIQTGKTGTILGDGTWSISNVTAFEDDLITVFVDGAIESEEAVGITVYDGIGNVSGLQLARRHLTLGSIDNPSLSNAEIGHYINSDDEDIFFSVNVSNVLTLCADTACGDAKLRVLSGTTYQPDANSSVVNFENYGTFTPATTTFRVSGNWLQNGTFTTGLSSIVFTATSSTFSLQTSSTTLGFYGLTFGEGSGTSTWTVTKPLRIDGSLNVNFGTLARGTSTIAIAQNLQIGSLGYLSGLATTTFDGSGSYTWGDAKSSTTSSNAGYVVVDGTARTVTLAGNVGAESVTIGADDTLNASGSGYNINVYKNWLNNNSFIPQTGTVTFVGTTTGSINRGASSFNNLSFSGVGGVWSFTTPTLSLTGNLSIATGTITLPTGTTTIAGSFSNTGGTFLHNNGEVRMTSTSGGRTITQSATAFLNAFYDLVFTGTGAWSFTETNATTSRNLRITAGTVTFPSGQLTVGGDLLTTGTGAFNHNSGEVVLLVADSDEIRTNGSSLNNVRTVGAVSSSWYNDSWQYRLPITILASQVDADLTNFPVYVNLDDVSSHFFTNVKTNGGDIRVTQSDGVTELPIEVVSLDTSGTTGELYFKASSVLDSANTTFYIYYGNSGASAYAQNATYGENNVWTNGYVLVEHLDDLTTATVENSEGAPDGTKTSAGNPTEVTTGKIYKAQDFSGDSIAHTDILGSQNQMSFSAWVNADNLTGSGDTATFGYSIFGISPAAAPYTWLTAGGTGNTDEFRFCAYSNSTTCTATVGADITTGTWYYVSVTAVDGATTTVRVNGVERASFNNPGDGTLGTNFTLGDLRPTRAINWDGQLDEVRVSNVVRNNAWQDAEYRNTASTTSFYTAGGYEQSRSRIFADTNVTILGNLSLGAGGDSTFATGVLSVGGSLTNNARFYANGGTVRFNSNAGAETINAGTSSFATLEFNSATGDFTVTENATATVAINLTSAQQFTLSSGKVLASQGTFTNAMTGANTTWTGSTLRLLSGSTVNLNTKTHGGDVYGTLEAASSTLVKMWNSSANTYSTSGTTGAIYSQDHATLDGDLYIFGNYLRTTGTEYWSYATDFDGVALLASTSRAVDVRVSTSSSVGFINSSLNLVGTAVASTTIDAQTGAFSLNATNTTITAEHFRVSGTDTNGFGLRASTTLSVFRDALFTVAPSRVGISIDATTVDTNGSAQFYRVGFATSSPGAASNVSLSGAPSSFVWFREGSGGLYGEAYDNGDGNPGSIRFDDSSNSIIVSGTVYADDGITTLGGPTCDGVTQNIRIVVDGGTYASSTSCSGVNGSYSFPAVNYIGDPRMVVYLDTNGGVQGSVVTKTPTTNITNMHIYANRVITRHQDVSPLSASDMQSYDYDNDTDLRFIAATTSLTLLPNTELYVFASTTFAPGGNITLTGNGNSNGYEGTLQIGTGATFTATGTQTHTLAGRLVLATTSTFTTASSTFIFNATTSGKSITSPNTITFNQVEFNGVGGGWNITAPLSILADMNVVAGTVTGTSNITLQNGSLYGNGVLSFGSGTTTINRTNTFGGTSAWTFNNLVFGNGTVVGTTTPNTSSTTTINGRLTIANAHFLDAGSSIWDLAGTGTVFTETGTLLEDTSTIRFSGAGANVPSTNYYNLQLNAGTGSTTYTGIGLGILVLNNLIVGGQSTSTFTINTTDQVVEVRGDVLIANNGTLLASNSAVLTVLGNWNNDGIFSGNNGTVKFAGTGVSSIANGLSNFSNIEIDGTGSYAVTENSTSTGAWSLINHANFTVNSGVTMAVGGAFLNNIAGTNTTWTGSNLYLYGNSTYEINDSATEDDYETLTIANGTQIRMWKSSATTYNIGATGSLYSQDHDGINGDLYIYGQLNRTTGDDYWSYDIDFDGTDITGSERIANVYFASSSSAIWSGNATLSVIGSSSATTTIQNQGVGTYSLTIGSSATTEWNYAQIRDINASGVVFAGSPTVTDFSRTDHLVKINGGSAITVGGTAINANEAKSFTGNIFVADTGVTGAVNVTATGTAVSSWRFTNHTGNIAGEPFDSDPEGNPGYITWDDSASLITVSGTVFQDESGTLSTICDGATNNIRLVVANDTTDTTFNTSCSVASSTFTITNVNYSQFDELVLYIVGETEKATTVTTEPISSISNLNLYENRVVVRHESTNPLTIERMSLWDSSDDAEIQFTAVDAGTDTLTIPANRKLLIWTGKTFEPNGNVTLSGGGAGADYDGTLEAQTNARFRAKATESHSVGGSVIFGAGAEFVSASSTLTLTTTGASRTFDVNANNLHNLSVTGVGSYNMTDATLTLGGSYTQSAGAFTFPTGTTTIGAAFNVTAGSFTHSGSKIVFNGSGAGNTVRFNNSLVPSLVFSGSGSWNMTDTNATSTGSVLITSGGVTLPSGSLTVGGSFEKRAGTLTHNTSDIIMMATSSVLLTASSSDLFAVRFVGSGPFTMTDSSITLLDSIEIASGTVALASTTTSVGGSFTATGGIFTSASGTVLFNASASGKTINPGNSSFYNLQIGAPAGGYTLFSATTTNNLTISSVSSLLVNSGATVAVGGVFTNSVGGSATTWTNTTLALNGATTFSLNSKSNTGDNYQTLVIGPNADIKMWHSSATTTTVDSSSSLYSQDHGNINGHLYIYGDLNITASTEYWSYATDFDGASLSGSERAVSVFMASNASTTVSGGSLQIVGSTGQETTIQNQTTGTYSVALTGGTLNANYYEFNDLDINGLQLQSLSTITNLANGYFDLAVDTGSLITLSSTTLNANPSKTFDNIGFNATTGISGYNINLVGETVNAWRLTNNYGNIGGEGFDIDGIDACGSIRFDDSSCLLTEQTHIRWRADDGGEGAPNTEWFSSDFGYRTRVRILNNDNQSYASTAVKIAVAYDASMKSDFSDLRFTSDDGQTQIPFWLEKYTASNDAQVWVKVPELLASSFETVFMYYGSSTATSISSTTATFSAIDDFEDNNLTEYSADTSLFTVNTSPVYGGTYALKPSSVSGKTTDGIFRFDQTVAQGQIIRYMQYVNTSGTSDEPCTLFGVQSPGTTNLNYGVCLEIFGTDRLSLSRGVQNNDSSGTVLASTTVSYTTGWYEVEIDWRTNNSINVALYNSAGTLVATTSATDSNYTSGGYGFAYWYQNGAWDSFTARPRVDTKPTVYFGAKQTPSGANWISALDSAGSAVPDDNIRLRVAIENSGLDVTGQLYRLEYAPKAVAPTCESVSEVSYVTVPPQSTCGSSPVCMQTSSFVTNGAVTTDLLFETEGTFSTGQVVTSPSSESSSLDIDQNYYTELEYALTPTINASDSYCFRVTNAGTPLDFYAKVAELSLQFDPTINMVELNGGLDISLTPGTTTAVSVTAEVSDFNTYFDFAYATATLYRSGVGPACTADNNNCYILSTENNKCEFTSCSGNSCQLTCQADMFFHADATVDGTFDGENWLAYAEIEDASAGYDFASVATGSEMFALRALQVDSAINYGALEANANTGSNNASTTITNIGNIPINVDVEGTDLTDGGSSFIPYELQRVATSTFDYAACGSCISLSTTTPTTIGINLSKPSVANPPVETDIYWGIAVPFGINSAPHSGFNTFTAIDI